MNPNPRILLIAGASSVPNEKKHTYSDIFFSEGASTVHTLPLSNRSDGNNPKYLSLLEDCDGVFITDGNQVKLASLLLENEFDIIVLSNYNIENTNAQIRDKKAELDKMVQAN